MRQEFLKKVAENQPQIFRTMIPAVTFGHPVSAPDTWFGFRFQELPDPPYLNMGERCYVDFGNHYTGYLRFHMRQVKTFPDAPTRVRIHFAENLRELEYDFDQYKGSISPVWLQQVIIDIDEPGEVILPRRYSFRYLYLEVINSREKLAFTDFAVEAVTSADYEKLPSFISNDPELVKMDEIGLHTLRECMQGVFEDGPKRDRRLWIGDLRLQALTNYMTFDNRELVKKCMYLFACYSNPRQRTDRFVFDFNEGSQGADSFFADYSLMFPICLYDYYKHTGDRTLVDELIHIAHEQMQIIMGDVCDGLLNPIEEWWGFIDWRRGLKKRTAMQGVILYTLDKMAELCSNIDQQKEALYYTQYAEIMRKTAYEKLYDQRKGLFVSEYDDEQLSVHSQVWMVLGGVVTGGESKALMQKVLLNKKMIQPVTPYMHHYLVEALIRADMYEEALEYMKHYWGGMVKHGADTYWEVYVPTDREVSPYDNVVMNSGCHAWSCSVSYFLRKYYQSDEKEGVNQ